MSENSSWSSSVGRWFDVPVRYHFLLISLCVLIFGLELNAHNAGLRVYGGTALVTVCLLLFSVTLHEVAHALAVKCIGGIVRGMTLLPWGGLSEYTLPPSLMRRTFVYLAGIIANGLIFVLGAYLLIISGSATLMQLINPLRPFEFDSTELLVSGLKIFTWINFQLFIFNLIPCYPFDGAHLLRNFISAIAGGTSKDRVESAIMVLGHGCAFGFIGLAFFIRDVGWGMLNSGWILLLIGGIVLVYSTRYSFNQRTARDDDEWPEEDVSELEPYYEDHQSSIEYPGFDYSDETENSIYSNWLREKEEERLEHLARAEAEENARMDSILEKLHHDGIHTLNQEERGILDRVSARLRRRRQQGV